METAWTIVGVIAALLLGVAVSLMGLNPPEYNAARACFWIAALLLGGTGLTWQLETDQPTWWRIVAGLLIWLCVGVGLPEALRWVSMRRAPPPITEKLEKPGPSFVFVFGAPLGANDSPTWVMTLTHFGPSTAFACDVGFYDLDRKNVLHQWSLSNNNADPPKDLVGESQKLLHVAEAGPEGNGASNFFWNPLNPNSQHYSVSIDCRDGIFVETWSIARVDGVLRSSITIEHGPEWVRTHPSQDPIVFRLTDPEYIPTDLAKTLPLVVPKPVDPGWKANQMISVPQAILDSNSRIQVVKGLRLPDGSTRTDFGTWNILTRHYGGPADK